MSKLECIGDFCNKKSNERNIYLDVVKCFTIFLVIWGHVVQQISQYSTWPEQCDPLFRIIYTTHMPLFMGVCGYFFAVSLKKWSTIYEYVRYKLPTRLLGLIIPMVSFGLFKTILDMELGVNEFSIFSFSKLWLGNARGIWFLGDLVLNTLVVLILSFFCTKNFSHDWKIFLWGIPLTMIPIITYSMPWMYFYFVVGFSIASYYKKSISVLSKYKIIILFIFSMCYITFSNMPWVPLDFSLNLNKYSFTHIFDYSIFE